MAVVQFFGVGEMAVVHLYGGYAGGGAGGGDAVFRRWWMVVRVDDVGDEMPTIVEVGTAAETRR